VVFEFLHRFDGLPDISFTFSRTTAKTVEIGKTYMRKRLPSFVKLGTKRVHCVRVFDEPPRSSSMCNMTDVAFLKNAVVDHSKSQDTS